MKKTWVKKICVACLTSAVLSSLCLGSASAVVFYNEDTGRYTSNDEADGTVAFYHFSDANFDEGSLIGEDLSEYLNDNEWRYLENLVPTDDVLVADNAVEPINSVVMLDEVESGISPAYAFDYIPTDDRLMFQWDAEDADTINVEVMDRASGNIIARGYHLAAGQTFKTAVDVSGKQLRILVASDSVRRDAIHLSFGSTDRVAAETFVPNLDYDIPAINDDMISLFSATITSSSVPKNIDGNQGKIIGQYTVEGKSGSRAAHAKFSKSTDGMKTINLALELEYGDFASKMNLKLGSQITTATCSVGQEFDIRVSTNSTGKNATIKCSSGAI